MRSLHLRAGNVAKDHEWPGDFAIRLSRNRRVGSSAGGRSRFAILRVGAPNSASCRMVGHLRAAVADDSPP